MGARAGNRSGHDQGHGLHHRRGWPLEVDNRIPRQGAHRGLSRALPPRQPNLYPEGRIHSMIDAPLRARPAAVIQQPGYVQIPDGVSLFYRDWGAGKPLLFLSGWTLNSLMWAYQMEPLSNEGLRCIAYDRRAHGRSSDPGRGYDFDTLADDLGCVIEALGLDAVTLVAHSFSSGEVVRYLSRHGSSRVAGVVFVAPAAIPFLLKADDNPGGVDGALFEQLSTALTEDFPGWAE